MLCENLEPLQKKENHNSNPEENVEFRDLVSINITDSMIVNLHIINVKLIILHYDTLYSFIYTFLPLDQDCLISQSYVTFWSD